MKEKDDLSSYIHNVFDSVFAERVRQHEKWGEQNHDFGSWLEIFQEELGEACKARMEARYRPGHEYGRYEGSLLKQKEHFREELIQSAAVLVAMIECGDRNGWFE